MKSSSLLEDWWRTIAKDVELAINEMRDREREGEDNGVSKNDPSGDTIYTLLTHSIRSLQVNIFF